MRKMILSSLIALFILSCTNNTDKIRQTIDFNWDWKFKLGDIPNADQPNFNDEEWRQVRLPHDWSIESGYQKENTAASTGFVEGGIGWYRKSFHLDDQDKNKNISIEFDGVYTRSKVWINGQYLGYRPNGYTSFAYDLTPYLNFNGDNVIAVRVDHSHYADARWYTGSGIYRNVRLVKKSAIHIPIWGVRISTPTVTNENAAIQIKTELSSDKEADTELTLAIEIADSKGEIVTNSEQKVSLNKSTIITSEINLQNPQLWDTENGNLYTAHIKVFKNQDLVDDVDQKFGIRNFHFDSKKGFFLNGKSVKIKGVNMHHDAGAVGAAATKAIWEYRIKKLKSIGVNALRMAHNPHSPELMEVCDEMGMLVMNEFFDEWHKAKEKSVKYLGDNAANNEISEGYSHLFLDWAERDLKDLIRRDYNHPSVILWSIGNEIEWTFPYYSETYSKVEGPIREYKDAPTYDTTVIKPVFNKITGGVDSLSIIAHKLSKWVKEMDNTRPVVCGSVRPTIAFASGYADAVDVLGLNYRAIDYDAAHAAFPEKCLLGSENWVAYSEWKACKERDFISGIFLWTGFAYLGEGGPWPRKGLDISLFDYAGFKNPRGHFFECLWKPEPKVYMVTTPASESEFTYSEKDGWKFNMQMTKPPLWDKLRLWEWYKVNEHWNYNEGEEIIVQAYTNCEEAELFLNGKSQGKQALADFAKTDNIIKWKVPFIKGELKVVGYNKGVIANQYILSSTGKLKRIVIESDKETLNADNYDIAHLTVTLFDTEDNEIKDLDTPIIFKLTGSAELLAVDNGWEMNVGSHHDNKVMTHNGKALAIIRSQGEAGVAKFSASIGAIVSDELSIAVKKSH